MRRLRPSSEAEMVALFLRTELPAARFRDTLRALLERDGLPFQALAQSPAVVPGGGQHACQRAAPGLRCTGRAPREPSALPAPPAERGQWREPWLALARG